jgi:DNA-binding winged helix-turn-helix (wHTH) protein
MRYVFEDFELDPLKGRLDRAGEPVDLKGLSLSFLTALVKAAPDPLGADVLARQVWGRHSVTEETLKKRVSLVRAAVGAELIRTLPDRTYVLSVTVFEQTPADELRAEPELITRAPKDPSAGGRSETGEREAAKRGALIRRGLFFGGLFIALVLATVVVRELLAPSEPARLVDPASGAVMDAPRG